VYASTPLVHQLALTVGRQLGIDAAAQALLELSVRVRDIGMIALPDAVVLATAPLSPADWELVNQHPVIGAELLEGLPSAAAAGEIVRAHHERWDGGGYPDGSRGDAIPLLSRVIATCDAFVAMANDRPHRRGMGAEAALEHISQQRGSQFDPQMVDALIAALTGSGGPRPVAPRVTRQTEDQDSGARAGRTDLGRAIAGLDVVPAFAPAYERVLAATAAPEVDGGELVTALESDTGLTIAVLRRAQTVETRHPIANVADAVNALQPSEIAETVSALPRAAFPWRTSSFEVLLHYFRVHAQAVSRAADRIVREVNLERRDDVLVAALLHDIGKLALARGMPDYAPPEKTTSPEERVRDERRNFGVDHASIGGLLSERWGLPKALGATIATHHIAEAQTDIAAYVRLADMVVHHAQGDSVDRTRMLRLAHACGLSAGALRDVMFDLPHAGGSQRRRAEPSPLSTRETEVLRVLAQGKVYKVIAIELGLSVSTVRTHLHNAYTKLGVEDRAQAVLRATEMGWI